MKYKERCEHSKTLAEEGKEYAKLLYNEAKRFRRYISSHPDCCNGLRTCYSSCCEFKVVCEEENK